MTSIKSLLLLVVVCSSLVVITGCSAKQVTLTNQWSDFDIGRRGDESGTTTTITNEVKMQNLMIDFGQRVLTPKELKEVKNSYDFGKVRAKEMMEKSTNSSFLEGSVNLHYVSNVTAPYKDIINEFLAKNPKAAGVHPDMILVGAHVYSFFKDFMVFEGMRTKEKQAEYVKKGVSWTNNSRHLIGQAYDLLAKNKHGKYDFKEIHRLGMTRGMFDYVHAQFLAEGKVCSEVEAVDKWKRVVDLYHWQINLVGKCKGRVVKVVKTLINFNV